MGIEWLFLIGLFGLLVFLYLLGTLTSGSGAELLDWDPVGRGEEKYALDAQDTHELLELANRRRRAQGLPELTADEIERQLEEGETPRL